jgi:hypothetical protein
MSIGETIAEAIGLLRVSPVFHTGKQIGNRLSFNNLVSNGFIIAGEKDIAERDYAFFDLGFFIIAGLLD